MLGLIFLSGIMMNVVMLNVVGFQNAMFNEILTMAWNLLLAKLQ